MSSPGGDLDQAIIMGEIIRSRGLATAVGVVDAAGRIKPSYCASACVLVFAGGKIRYGVEGSALGVHRFVTATPGRDPVAETQRTEGTVLNYVTRMGVSPSIVEAMSATKDVRWLGAQQAVAMNLVTNAVSRRNITGSFAIDSVNLNYSPRRKLRGACAQKSRVLRIL